MKSTMAMMMAMITLGAVETAARQRVEADAVRVQVYYNVPLTIDMDEIMFGSARAKASQLLAEAGIRLEWHLGEPTEREVGAQVVAMNFLTAAPKKFRCRELGGALAAAQPYGSGRSIEVFNDRVTRYLSPFKQSIRSKVMGHILAHEIVHVLQGVARHSKTGLMKANWTWRELSDMTATGLSMSREDRDLLQLRFMPTVAMASVAAGYKAR